MVQTDQRMGLNLNLSIYSLTKPLSQFLDEVSRIKDNNTKLSEIDCYVRNLQQEMNKIDCFKKELPLCMLLLNEAICSLKEEALKGSSSSSSSSVAESESDEKRKKKTWMSSAQLWVSNSQLNSSNEEEEEEEDQCVAQGGAFMSFNPPPPLSVMMGIEEDQYNKRVQSHHHNNQKKEQRRRWSEDLHRKFVDALHALGGSHVATPKQIRDLMQVNGLTNDEVKSHLQKYRMHIRKHPTKTVSSMEQPGLLGRETQSLISLSRSVSPQSPVVERGLFSNNVGHTSEVEEEEKSDGRSWKSERKKKRQCLDLEL